MNSRWFYILFANIAVLTANIWLFVDKPNSIPKNVATVTDKLKDKEVISIDAVSFLFNEPLVSHPQDLQPHLSHAQKNISQKEIVIKKVQQQSILKSNQIKRLEKQNNKLSQQLFLLDAELKRREVRLAKSKQNIDKLVFQKKQEQNPVFKTPVQRVKTSIESKPDLVVLSTPKKIQTHSTGKEEAVLLDKIDAQKFSGSMEFGFKYEQDNQVTRVIKGRLVLDYDEPKKYNFHSDLDFEFESEDDEISTDKYRWQLQSDYNLNPSNTVFARSDISRSQFASYQQEDIFTVGYGRIFFNTYEHKFNLEVGPGYRSAVPNIGQDAVSIDEFIVRTRLNYERIITKTLQVKVDAVLEAGDSNSVYSFNFKVQNRIYQALYIIFDFEYKYTENVPVDTVNKEVSSGLSLLYSF